MESGQTLAVRSEGARECPGGGQWEGRGEMSSEPEGKRKHPLSTAANVSGIVSFGAMLVVAGTRQGPARLGSALVILSVVAGVGAIGMGVIAAAGIAAGRGRWTGYLGATSGIVLGGCALALAAIAATAR